MMRILPFLFLCPALATIVSIRQLSILPCFSVQISRQSILADQAVNQHSQGFSNYTID